MDSRSVATNGTVLPSAQLQHNSALTFSDAWLQNLRQTENGKESIELAKQVKPDVITLDLAMPVMNGLHAAPVLRKLFPKTSIILFTLYADTFVQSDALGAGVTWSYRKPESLATLIDHELMGE